MLQHLGSFHHLIQPTKIVSYNCVCLQYWLARQAKNLSLLAFCSNFVDKSSWLLYQNHFFDFGYHRNEASSMLNFSMFNLRFFFTAGALVHLRVDNLISLLTSIFWQIHILNFFFSWQSCCCCHTRSAVSVEVYWCIATIFCELIAFGSDRTMDPFGNSILVRLNLPKCLSLTYMIHFQNLYGNISDCFTSLNT